MRPTRRFRSPGRISARRGDAGVAGAFTWTHDAAHDAIDLSTPLGQTLAKLEGGANGVEVRLPDGRTQTAAYVARTHRACIRRHDSRSMDCRRGCAAFHARRSRSRSSAMRAVARRCCGSRDGKSSMPMPTMRPSGPLRASLSYPGPDTIEVRVVVDRWQ
jgi:hypothetical protein